MARNLTNRERKLIELRSRLWPDAENKMWKSSGEKGYFCAPRVLPLLLRLMGDKRIFDQKGGGNCGDAYVELLARDQGHGVVEIGSHGEHAVLCGYDGKRGIRTWADRLRALARVGFIEIAKKGRQELGTVLIIHPHLVVLKLKEEGKLSREWLDHYDHLQIEYRASVPESQSDPGNGESTSAPRDLPVRVRRKRARTE